MIGGTVVETIVLPDKVWINCEENDSTSQCAIYVKRTDKARSISPGDSVWWQSGWAFWTPYFRCDRTGGKVGKDYDIALERIGFSGVKRPEVVA